LVLKIRSTGALGASGRDKAMAVIWLRDIPDGDRRTVTAVLWHSDDFARLKQNYVELNHELEEWETGSAKASRLGTIEIDLSLSPGISKAHKGMMRHAADSKLRSSWEVWARSEDAADGDGDSMPPDSQMDSSPKKGNTELAPEETEDKRNDEDSSTDSSEKSLRQRTVDFKEHQEELHRQHRGVMQMKPARTAEWMRDNVKIGAEKLKGKFDLDARNPTVETEV